MEETTCALHRLWAQMSAGQLYFRDSSHLTTQWTINGGKGNGRLAFHYESRQEWGLGCPTSQPNNPLMTTKDNQATLGARLEWNEMG